MPPLSGEDRILTVFADVHYYFTPPTPKPWYHRFEKGSYLYFYHDTSQGKARIEIANNPGTSFQDAFHGVLDHVHLRHSVRFPTLCTLTVNAPAQNSSGPGAVDQGQWLLPLPDPRDETRRLLRLHTLDIYFWTLEDANTFLDTYERLLAAGQLETDRQPQHPPSVEAMSTVVQNLEKVAITDPAYQHGQTRDSRSESTSRAQRSARSSLTQQTDRGTQDGQRGPEVPVDHTPLPYNPSAPADPEPFKHREKTPPPVDGSEGTGLAAAAVVDEGQSYPPSSLSGAFIPQATQPPSYAIPGPVQTGYSLPQDPNAHLYVQQAYGSHQPHHQSLVHQQHAPQYVDYLQSHMGAATTSVLPPGPPGGYSDYSYDHPPRQLHDPSGNEYDIHSQVYRPSEAEMKSHLQKHAKEAIKNAGNRPHKLEDGAYRVENSVNKFLKKLEKKF